jgi:hypothetical protein
MTMRPDPNPDHPLHRAFAVLELADHIIFQHELKLMIEFGNAAREPHRRTRQRLVAGDHVPRLPAATPVPHL